MGAFEHQQGTRSDVPPALRSALRSPGEPLDAATREFMEPRLARIIPTLAMQLATATPSDRFEREADAVADRLGRTPAPTGGARHDLGGVRIHTDPQAAASASAVDAQAFAVGRHMFFGPGRFSPHTDHGRSLLAHELAHVVQQTRHLPADHDAATALRSAPIARKPNGPGGSKTAPPRTGVGKNPPADAVKAEFENQYIPSEIKTRIPVAAPSLERGKRPTVVTLAFDVKVEPLETFTLYAVPESELFETAEAARLPKGKERDEQSLLVRGVPKVPPSPIPPAVPSPPASPAPAQYHTSQGPIPILTRSGGFGITAEFNKLAVGAASTTVAKTPNGIIVIDAGTAGGAAGPIADGTMVKLEARIGGQPIAKVLFTHAHLDHTALLARLAARFELLSLHINIAQLMALEVPSAKEGEPKLGFEEFKAELAQSQRAVVESKLRAEVEATKAKWEAENVIPQPEAREAQWRQYVEEQVAARLAARTPLSIELQVPGVGSEVHVVSAPIEQIELAEAPTGGKPAVDPNQASIVNKNLAKAMARQKAAAGKEDEFDIDRYSTSYVLVVGEKILALVLPDLRVNDIKAIRTQLKAAMQALGKTAELRVWDIGHHLQPGFLRTSKTEKAPTLQKVRASQLLKLTEILKELVNVKNAQGLQPADLVTVSAHAAKMDPALAVIFESMGFSIVPALGETDVRLIEAFTPAGRKVAGLAGGQRYAGPSPADPLLRKAHAAIEELTQKAEDLESRARKLRKKADKAEKDRLNQEADTARKKIETIGKKVKNYIRQVDKELAPQGKAKTKTPAPGTAPTEPAAAQAADLRAELAEFKRPVVGTLGTFSDVALAILGDEIPAETRADLQVLRQVRELYAQLAGKTDAPPELRARYLTALEAKRNVVRRRLTEANKQGQEAGEERKVLRDELVELNEEIRVELKAAGATGEGPNVYRRRLPNGKLVETRIEAPKRPSKFERGVHGVADIFGRGMGAVMVYTLVKGETELEERYQRGEAGALEATASTVHNLYGISIGVRMMGAIHVGAGEFILLSALDITQTALREYETTAQRNTAIAYSVIRNALSLGLMYVGQRLMAFGPWGVLAGLGIMFLVDPILEAFGVYEWLERKFSFMPDEVVEVTQELNKLLDDYRVIIGALQIAERDVERLKEVGATDPAGAKRAAWEVVSSYRSKAKDKEARVLVAFLRGYEVAKTSYGGLPGLDQYRAEFLKLMLMAHGAEAPKQKTEEQLTDATKAVILQRFGLVEEQAGLSSREKAEAVFHTIEQGMTLQRMTPEAISKMGQWSKMDDWMNKIAKEILLKDAGDIDWKWVAEKVGELDQMFDNARYRLNPADLGAERMTPLLPENSPGRLVYERELMERERRFLHLRGLLAEASAGMPRPTAGSILEILRARMAPWTSVIGAQPGTSVTLDAALQSAEAAVKAYRDTLDKQPKLGNDLTAEGVASHSWEAGTAYPYFVNHNDDYKAGLFRMKALELAMGTSLRQAQSIRRATATVSAEQDERLGNVLTGARQVIEERKEVKGFLFLDEAQEKIAGIRMKENLEVAALLGQRKEIRPLSPEEQEAAGKGALEPHRLTTISNRLAQISQLRFPSPEEIKAGKTRVEGIYKVVGTYGETDLFILSLGGQEASESDNVLVGFVRERGETTSGLYGHTTRVEVTPLNDAAVRFFDGTSNQTLLRNLLYPASIDDIRTGL